MTIDLQRPKEKSFTRNSNTMAIQAIRDTRNKPFWIWDREQHKQEDIRTNGDCCFNHIIGLPQKHGEDKPLYDYEQLIFDALVNNNSSHIWIKKAAGLGISEFILRFMELLSNATTIECSELY